MCGVVCILQLWVVEGQRGWQATCRGEGDGSLHKHVAMLDTIYCMMELIINQCQTREAIGHGCTSGVAGNVMVYN
jgi:hypothetical protein